MLLHRVWLILIYTGSGDKNSILSYLLINNANQGLKIGLDYQ